MTRRAGPLGSMVEGQMWSMFYTWGIMHQASIIIYKQIIHVLAILNFSTTFAPSKSVTYSSVIDMNEHDSARLLNELKDGSTNNDYPIWKEKNCLILGWIQSVVRASIDVFSRYEPGRLVSSITPNNYLLLKYSYSITMFSLFSQIDP